VPRPALIAALLVAAVALASCGGADDGATYTGDPTCFAKDAKDATCTSSEGVIYRVVDRDSIGALGALRIRLAQGPLPAGRASVAVTVQLTPKGPYDGDISLQQANGQLYVPKTRVRKGDRLTVTWAVTEEVVKKLYDYPSYITFFQAPAQCPGAKAQCFIYFRLWK
jgi:hypothetical protein